MSVKELRERSEKEWALVALACERTSIRTTFLSGPPGVGKTYGFYKYGRVGRGVEAITLTQDTPAAELRGHFIPRGGELVWHDGPFVQAMRKGSRLVINEISHASPDVWAILYPVLESAETARLTLPTGETVFPAEGFHVCCTDNRPLSELPEALQDRFDAALEVTTPHPDAVKALPEEFREPAIILANPTNQAHRISLRKWSSIKRQIDAGATKKDAFVLVLGPKLGRSFDLAAATRKALEEV